MATEDSNTLSTWTGGTCSDTEPSLLSKELVESFPLALANRLVCSAPPSTERSLQRLVTRARERAVPRAAPGENEAKLDEVYAFDWQALLDLEAWRSTHAELGLRESFLCACARLAQETFNSTGDPLNESKEYLAGTRLCWPLVSGPCFLSFGCSLLDEIIRVRFGAITEIYGEAGSGKTQLLLQLAARNPVKTLYLYSESGRFPSERLAEIATAKERLSSPDDTLDRILVERRRSALGSPAALLRFARGPLRKLLEQQPEPQLLIIDSIAAVVRHAYDHQQRSALTKRARWMFRFVSTLRQLMRDHRLAVLVSNQVSQRMDGELIPALGLAWSQCINTRIRLERGASVAALMHPVAESSSCHVVRCAKVCFGDWGPEPGSIVSFQIDQTGARGIQVSYSNPS
ncbi:DNA repair protein xrcc3 [Cyanidiococcus yangmingshanensis]|uniref:DNA repair protein xrcc3 n=1 Tax=Cyanidiococcus yangmingshanensis TaxID=2690220 RepID=A0A7J7II98_9RHOD|nr:DNA repair protein xrcc3 [Cyanidiococcus yangmingshanensis]